MSFRFVSAFLQNRNLITSECLSNITGPKAYNPTSQHSTALVYSLQRLPKVGHSSSCICKLAYSKKSPTATLLGRIRAETSPDSAMAPATRARPRPTIKISRRRTQSTNNNNLPGRIAKPSLKIRRSKAGKPKNESEPMPKALAAAERARRLCNILLATLKDDEAEAIQPDHVLKEIDHLCDALLATVKDEKAEAVQIDLLKEINCRCDVLLNAMKEKAEAAKPSCLICYEPFSTEESSPMKAYSCPNEACVARYCVGCKNSLPQSGYGSRCPHCRCELDNRTRDNEASSSETEPRTSAMVVRLPTQRRHRWGV